MIAGNRKSASMRNKSRDHLSYVAGNKRTTYSNVFDPIDEQENSNDLQSGQNEDLDDVSNHNL